MESFKTYLEEQKLAKTTITNHLRNLGKLDIKLLEGPEPCGFGALDSVRILRLDVSQP